MANCSDSQQFILLNYAAELPDNLVLIIETTHGCAGIDLSQFQLFIMTSLQNSPSAQEQADLRALRVTNPNSFFVVTNVLGGGPEFSTHQRQEAQRVLNSDLLERNSTLFSNLI